MISRSVPLVLQASPEENRRSGLPNVGDDGRAFIYFVLVQRNILVAPFSRRVS